MADVKIVTIDHLGDPVELVPNHQHRITELVGVTHTKSAFGEPEEIWLTVRVSTT